MESIKKKYPGIDHPMILKLLEILPRQPEFMEEQRIKREKTQAFQKQVMGDAVKELQKFSPFKELKKSSKN